MSFANPDFLQIGAGIILLVALGFWSHMRRRRKLAAFLGGVRGATRLSGSNLFRPRLERFALTAGAAAAIALAAAEPRLPEREVVAPPPPPTGRVVFAIDVSASMQAADEDPTRLGRAVAVVESLLPALAGDRVGFVLFAGEAYPIAPPTSDHETLRYLLAGVTPRVASAWDPGSLLSAGISAAAAMLPADPERPGPRTIIVLSDGEAGESRTAIARAVEAAREAGIAVHAVGVGRATGARMSLTSGPFQLGGPVLDPSGAPAVSRLREATLRELAESGGGLYLHAADAGTLAALRATLTRPPAPAIPTEPATLIERYDLATLLAALALLLLLTESLLDVRWPGSGLATARALARRPG